MVELAAPSPLRKNLKSLKGYSIGLESRGERYVVRDKDGGPGSCKPFPFADHGGKKLAHAAAKAWVAKKS